MNDAVLVVVASGDYPLGAGVLLNALARRGFGGEARVHVDRGTRPRWWPADPGAIPGVRLVLRELDPGVPAAWQKAAALLAAARERPDAGRFFLVDADLVPADCPWSFLESWPDAGVAVFRDLWAEGELGPLHPVRRRWAAWLAGRGFRVARDGGPYVNSGFVGLGRPHLAVAERWAAIQARLVDEGVPPSLRLDPADPARWATGPGLRFGDQDALNLALMAGDEPVAALEASAMGLGRGGECFAHPVGGAKPWRWKPWTEAWRGTPPDEATRRFWQEAVGPLAVFPVDLVARRRRSLPGAFALPRFPLGLKFVPRALAGLLSERLEDEP